MLASHPPATRLDRCAVRRAGRFVTLQHLEVMSHHSLRVISKVRPPESVVAQQWGQVIGGPGGSKSVASYFAGVSFGQTLLSSYDIVQVDVGCPSTTCAPF